MLNSGVTTRPFTLCPDEERLFKGPGPGIKCIALTGENKLIIKNGICKFNEGVYNNLQILAIYGGIME